MGSESKNIYPPDHDLLVFEGRHKAYGAFLLRKFYKKRLVRGLIIAILVLLLFIFLPLLLSLIFREKDYTVVADLSNAPGTTYKLPEPPSSQKKTLATANQQKAIAPRISDHPKSDSSSNTNSTGDDKNAKDGSSSQASGGNGNGQNLDFAPTFPGVPGGETGMKGFIKNFIEVNPNDLKDDSVVVGFVVGADGRLKDFHIIKSATPALDKAALNVIREMPEWIPGKQNGKAVEASVRISVPFTNRRYR